MLTQSSAGQSAGPTSTDLELVTYGRGHAWLRPALEAAVADADQVHERLTRLLERRPEPQPEDRRYALTQRGRDLLARWRAEVALFGREVSA